MTMEKTMIFKVSPKTYLSNKPMKETIRNLPRWTYRSIIKKIV